MANASNLRDGSRESGFAVIDVADGTDVHMRLPATDSHEFRRECHEPIEEMLVARTRT
jgi:hypothetical protein